MCDAPCILCISVHHARTHRGSLRRPPDSPGAPQQRSLSTCACLAFVLESEVRESKERLSLARSAWRPSSLTSSLKPLRRERDWKSCERHTQHLCRTHMTPEPTHPSREKQMRISLSLLSPLILPGIRLLDSRLPPSPLETPASAAEHLSSVPWFLLI